MFLLLLPLVHAQYYDQNIGQNIAQDVALCNDGDTRCEGSNFQTCMQDTWITSEQCPFACHHAMGCTVPQHQTEEALPSVSQVREVCREGAKKCDKQNFQICQSNTWKTQQTCGKYQECTDRGCKAIVQKMPEPVPIPVPLPPTAVEVAPIPEPEEISIEIPETEIEEMPVMTEKKGVFSRIIDFFKGLFGSKVEGIELGGPRADGILIDLTGWLKGVPDEEIKNEPFAGSLHIYWLDVEWNVCHGIPGESGMPGTFEIPHRNANDFYKLSKTKKPTGEEIKLFQKSVYYIKGFDGSEYDGTGVHIMHFEARFWRSRETGLILFAESGFKSLPAEMAITEKTINPTSFKPQIAVKKDSTCVYTRPAGGGMSAMKPLAREKQHPTKCKVKSKITAKDLKAACLADKLEGDFASDYLKIKSTMIKSEIKI